MSSIIYRKIRTYHLLSVSVIMILIMLNITNNAIYTVPFSELQSRWHVFMLCEYVSINYLSDINCSIVILYLYLWRDVSIKNERTLHRPKNWLTG